MACATAGATILTTASLGWISFIVGEGGLSPFPFKIWNMKETAFEQYIKDYGWHFNKKASDYAVGLMKRLNPATGKAESIEPMTKDMVEEMLTRYEVKLDRNKGYDMVYVANMLKSDKYKSSIPDEQHLAMGVKDEIDDIDAGDGSVFRCWMAKMYARKEPIFWDDLV